MGHHMLFEVLRDIAYTHDLSTFLVSTSMPTAPIPPYPGLFLGEREMILCSHFPRREAGRSPIGDRSTLLSLPAPSMRGLSVSLRRGSG
jgi:hypothetical protein